MYIKGHIRDLIPIEEEDVEEFIISPLDELDYFNCNKEDLISLRDYLLELKEKKKEYNKLIAEPLKSIKEKNNWCVDVQPANTISTQMVVKAKNYPSIFIYGNSDNKFALGYHPILNRIYCDRYIKRSQVVLNSKDELLEIRQIIDSFDFMDAQFNGLVTASNRFLIIPYNFEKICIDKKVPALFRHTIEITENNEIKSDYCGLTYFNNRDSKKYANCFVNKLYLIKK